MKSWSKTMSNVLSVPPAIVRYLEALERELKQNPGISPEEALSDAREFLIADYEALVRSGEPPEDSSHYDWIVQQFGPPSQIAKEYAKSAPPTPSGSRMGNAPGWRVCCTKCGRSAPYAAIGGIRIGARSIHKYIGGYCHGCRKFRFLRLLRDLDDTNLTRALCLNQSPEQMRQRMHKPVLTILLILALVIGIQAIVWTIILLANNGKKIDPPDAAAAPNDSGDPFVTSPFQESASNATAQKAFATLKNAVETQYSYRDLRGVNWTTRFEEYQSKIEAGSSREEFAKLAAEMMSPAKDPHIWIQFDKKTIGTFQNKADSNFNPKLLPRLLKSLKQHGKTVLTAMATDRIQYVAIGTWDHSEPQSMQIAFDTVKQAASRKTPLIIDVRPNGGGDERQAQRVAGYFVTKPTPYAANRNWTDGKTSSLYQRVLQPSQDGIVHPGPCVVLMGPRNLSSCESFLRMMKESGATLIGMPSSGSSGNPKPHDLGNGVTIFLPSWQDCDLQGNVVEGEGIKPDVLVETKPEEFAKEDRVLAKAIELLQKTP
jgi:hypothetical protein